MKNIEEIIGKKEYQDLVRFFEEKDKKEYMDKEEILKEIYKKEPKERMEVIEEFCEKHNYDFKKIYSGIEEYREYECKKNILRAAVAAILTREGCGLQTNPNNYEKIRKIKEEKERD